MSARSADREHRESGAHEAHSAHRAHQAHGADVVVVGAGPAGCVMSRRLAEAGADVLLLEAGAEVASRRAGLLDVGPESRVVDQFPAELGGEALDLPRGRALGGSGAVNGGYCAPARPADLEAWGADWPRRYAVGLARAAERLRPHVPPADPVAAWVSAAFPGAASYIAQASHGDRRVTAFDAWDPPGAGVRVVSGAPVRELRWAGGRVGGRCDGVVLDDDEEVGARTVILCAGAIGTASVLSTSGIGSATGHPVGRRTEEHPEVLLDLPTAPSGVRSSPGTLPLTTPGTFPPLLSRVVRLELPTTAGVAEVEVRPYAVPMHRVIPGLDPQPHRIGVALMNAAGRGELRPGPDGRTRVVLDAHPDARDDAVLAEAAALVGDRLSLDAPPVVSTSQHLSGSARIGEVVDDSGRVLDVDGLRLADASVFPTLPGRGPYYSVLAVAEDLAARVAAESPW